MNAPLIWIVIPAAAAVLIIFLTRWHRVAILAGGMLALGLAVAAWQLPTGEEVSLGPLSFQISPVLNILGRRFEIGEAERQIVLLLYGAVAFWFLGAYIARVERYFVPLGLGVSAALTAAFSVEPFLYAPLLIELAVLISVPILASPNKSPGRGVLRYLTFQSLGFPLLLFTGWILERLASGQGGEAMQIQVLFLIALGLLLMLGVFPFHTWITMLARESHPYASTFVLYLFPLAVMLVGLNYLDRFIWIQSQEMIFNGLAYLGAVMVLLGGVWASFQGEIGRVLGFAAMLEVGLSLLAVSLTNTPQIAGASLGIFFALTMPRALALALWALAVIVLSSQFAPMPDSEPDVPASLTLDQISGSARSLPFASLSLMLAVLSLAGFPLLAGFPGRLALISLLAEKSPMIAFLTLSGLFGLVIAAYRMLAVLLVHRGESGWSSKETWLERIFMGVGCILLILVGVLPQIYTPLLAQMAQVFPNILP